MTPNPPNNLPGSGKTQISVHQHAAAKNMKLIDLDDQTIRRLKKLAKNGETPGQVVERLINAEQQRRTTTDLLPKRSPLP